ncbi:SLC13 family permease [Novispirillum itersonii]|uniref:Di/tricarboxylate transporter n=1 Tax=Novispirillum itersonii TaxID=189 RepID=A0A7X0DMK4_NOVIT|nr:SLC13 family permease [Novispirillum itersonii]MBB6211173.1 di/tricarboxylate transporter [Novispirillum itersonii]
MSPDLLTVLLFLAAAVLLFAINRPRMDVVALLLIVAMPLSGVITMQEALAGFSDPSVILIAALFVVGEGLVRTGVAQRMGDWLVMKAGRNENRLLGLLMVSVAGIGSVMSSTGVVAIFIPVVLRITRAAGLAAGRLMMPLSMAALISGMMTLVATPPNLVVHAELQRHGLPGFGFFDFTPVGVPVLLLGVAYMAVARRWLTVRGGAKPKRHRPRLADWVEKYRLHEREYRLRVAPLSPLVGQRLSDLNLRAASGVNIVLIERATPRLGDRFVRPLAHTVLEAGDVIYLDLSQPTVDVDHVAELYRLDRLPLTAPYFSDRTHEIGMVEVMVPPTSRLVGKTVLTGKVRSDYDLTVIGLHRNNSPHPGRLLDTPLKTGDTLLLIGPWKAIRRLQADPSDLIVLTLPAEVDDAVPAAGRAPQALAALAVMVGLMVSGAVPNVQAALIACLLLGALRCVDLSSAYRSIHWQSLILIVGMLPFSIALQRTGGVTLAADVLIATTGGASLHTVLACLFAVTAVLGLFISNTATAVLMAPVALAVAQTLGASPLPFAMTVALAASAAFMTPVSSPVNTLVVGPGNYTFGDFIRIGVPFTLIVMAVTVALVPLLFPAF